MILTYPMLTSSSVSPSAIPGICKALERYIIMYQIDSIIRAAKSGGYNIFLGSGKRLFLKEAGPDLFPEPTIKPDKGETDKERQEREKEEREKERHKWEKEKAERERRKEVSQAKEEEAKVRKASVSVATPDTKSLSAEPSFLIVNTGAGPAPLGIKVLSFPVQSDVTLAELMTSDLQLKKLEGFLVRISRGLRRMLWRMLSNLPILRFFVGRGTVTGDPERDIIIERTAFKGRVLTCINYMDLQQDFFEKPGRINRLFKLGWKDFVIADDVNKRAFFCLSIFGGMCTAVPYSFLYATIGKEDVYNSLDDVKRASGPLFRMSGKASKIFGESLALARLTSYKENLRMDLVQKFLDELYLNEQTPGDLTSFAKKLKPSSIKSLIAKIEATKDPTVVKKILSFVPAWSLPKIEGTCRKLSPDFNKCYTLAKKVIQNSISNVPDDVASLFACGVAIRSSYKSDDPVGEVKKNLKSDISKFRKVQRAWHDKDHLPAYIGLGTIIVLMGSIITFMFLHPFLVALIFLICGAIATLAVIGSREG